MLTLLVPCDGSPDALAAVRHVIRAVRGGTPHRIHLVNVQTPLRAYIARHVDPGTRRDFYRERAEQALAPARALLDAAGLNYHVRSEVGDKAECIVSLSQSLRCDRIVLGTARKSGLVRAIAGSLTTRVIEHATVPVEVIGASPASALERFGIPAGLGAGLTLLWVA